MKKTIIGCDYCCNKYDENEKIHLSDQSTGRPVMINPIILGEVSKDGFSTVNVDLCIDCIRKLNILEKQG